MQQEQEVHKKKLLTISEVAAYLSIKQKTIYAKVEAGEIPHYHIGRLIRFRLDEVNAWLDGCKKENKPGVEQKRIKNNRKKSSSKSNGHFDKIVGNIIDEETNKYYSSNHGKSDRIEGLGKEVNNGSI
jgi:excisionase family DNA binding protein